MSQTKTFIGFTPTSLQKRILAGVLEGQEKYHVVSCGRQVGKTMLAMNLMLYWAINYGPCKIMFVSPVYAQAAKVHKELYAAIAQSGIVASNNFSSNELELKTGTRIIFRSAERYDNIRGETVDFACLDEFAFMKPEAWTEAIKPTLLVRGRKCLFLSTPKGKTLFYELFLMGQSPEYPDYKSYTASSYDTPFINPSEIDEAKRTLPEAVFRQEYLAEFIDSGGEVFTDIDKNCFPAWTPPVGKVYCGVDIGRAQDWTVATFMDASGKIVDIYRNNQMEWSQMVKDILNRVRKWNATVVVEINGLGDPIFEMLKKEWPDTHPFTTTNTSKNEIIEGMILDINENTLKIPSQDLFWALYSEMTVFTYEYNAKTRSIRYTHPPTGHDDTIIATALANWNRKKNKTLGTYNYVKPRR